MPNASILVGDCRQVLATLPEKSVHCVITSPPYWGLRDYGVDGQIGLEESLDQYLDAIVEVFRGVWRVLRDDGTCWVNLGDAYATRPNGPPGEHSTLNGSRHAPWESRKARSKRGGSGVPAGLKHKDLMGLPWRVAFALQADGWYLRSDIVWHKTNPMPESVEDRPTKAHEYIFLLTKRERYFYDAGAIKEPASGTAHGRGKGIHPKSAAADSGIKANVSFSEAVRDLVEDRNKRTVWTVSTQPFDDAHFATFPPKLITPCVLAGTSERGVCPACAAPWVRRVEKYRTIDGVRVDSVPAMRNVNKAAPSGAQGIGHGRTGSVTVTLGWEPSCACGLDATVPAVVLDPFNGAGTTGLVSLRHGRHYLGVELNPDYAAMSRARIAGDAPLFHTVS